MIRVYLPDRWVLQGCFRPRESCKFKMDIIIFLAKSRKDVICSPVHVTAVKALVRFIRENLADPSLKFHLCECMPC